MLGDVRGGALSAILLIGLLGACGKPTQSGARAPTAESPAEREQPIPVDLRAAVTRSCDIGRELYVLDKIAAIGTDVLLANVEHPESKHLAGYLPLRESDESGEPTGVLQVAFFTSEQPPRIAYRIHIDLKQKPRFEALEPPVAAHQGMLALVRSRQAALDAVPHPTQPLNPVLIPAEAYGESGTLVYLIAGTKQPKIAVFGKHYRALVPTGGNQVTYLKELSKTALEMPTEQAGQAAVALAITHVVSEYPLETHVFTSLLLRLPIYVATSRGTWRVNGDQIAFLGPGS
jgi:hypothetical protein